MGSGHCGSSMPVILGNMGGINGRMWFEASLGKISARPNIKKQAVGVFLPVIPALQEPEVGELRSKASFGKKCGTLSN
jgi:hypothetical protein